MAVQTTEEFKSAGSTSYTTAIEKLKDTDLKVRIGGALQTYVASSPSSGQYTVTNNPTTIKLEKNIKHPATTVFLSFTTCKRLDLFEKTVNSLLLYCEDIDTVDYFFCVDDNSSFTIIFIK